MYCSTDFSIPSQNKQKCLNMEYGEGGVKVVPDCKNADNHKIKFSEKSKRNHMYILMIGTRPQTPRQYLFWVQDKD